MAITQIGGKFISVNEILQRPTNANNDLLNTQPIFTTQAVNLSSRDAILIQAQTIINETLQNLTSPEQASLLLNRALDNLSFSQQTQVLNQSRILLDTALENLGSNTEASLLIDAKALLNETLTRLNTEHKADLVKQIELSISEAIGNLGPPQQAETLIQTEVLINAALQNLTNLPGRETFDQTFFLGLPETTLSSSGAFIANSKDFNLFQFESGQVRLDGVETTVVAQAQAQSLEEVAIAINQTPTTETTSFPGAPVSAETVSLATALPAPIEPIESVDPIPYGIAVYEVISKKTAPLDPEPETKSVKPTPPVEKAGLFNLIFHWTRGDEKKEKGHPVYVPSKQPPGEEVLRKIIHHFNENQVNKNQPNRLVLVSGSDGLALDVYDCSDQIVCQLAYNAPLGTNGLAKIMDHIRDDDGVFISTKT